MTIRFVENTNIRSRPDLLGDESLLGQVFAGAYAEVDDMPYLGAEIEHNDHWWRDANGWFYWSGGTEMLEQEAVTAPASAPVRSAVFEADPLADLDDLAETVTPESIPPGETRPASLPGTPVLRRDAPIPLPTVLPLRSRASDPVSVENKPLTPSVAPGWAVRDLDLPERWWPNGLTGKGVRVAILSTGVAANCADLNGAVAASFQAKPDGPADDNDGLGTQAAVVAAGRGPLCLGAAPEATLLVGKIGELDHLITAEALLAGVDWALSQRADVVAMLVDFPEMDEEAQRLLQQKISDTPQTLFVAPVGNSTERAPQQRFPASLDGVLAVGAHDSLGQRSFFSARSYHLDLLAPGEGLLVVAPGSKATVANRPTTAVAAAFVAGVLALLRQREPDATPTVLIEQLHKAAVSPKPHVAPGEDVEYGYGRLVMPDF